MNDFLDHEISRGDFLKAALVLPIGVAASSLKRAEARPLLSEKSVLDYADSLLKNPDMFIKLKNEIGNDNLARCVGLGIQIGEDLAKGIKMGSGFCMGYEHGHAWFITCRHHEGVNQGVDELLNVQKVVVRGRNGEVALFQDEMKLSVALNSDVGLLAIPATELDMEVWGLPKKILRVPEQIPWYNNMKLHALGYPDALVKSDKYRNILPLPRLMTVDNNRDFDVSVEGVSAGGDSGGSVFFNKSLVGVLTASDPANPDKISIIQKIDAQMIRDLQKKCLQGSR